MNPDNYQCTTVILSELFRSQIAIAHALTDISAWMTDNGDVKAAFSVNAALTQLLKSKEVIEPILYQMAVNTLATIQAANDEKASNEPRDV
ncbi:hypothetical protein LOY24_04140 [Pseudomonas putida]|uniref:hypothetical protein n=1 Tax=Pseudomonas putida TaxID=303 RepID=UPI00215E06F8|nr:hypothetical protein [Pseudomonas putida]UVL79336.1 hypothetical protein LOY24_04140 [Pseudomonas putida]